ncbi:PIR protein [Plasmodium vivax]|nr:PIR protein [Plasmodium vivax]
MNNYATFKENSNLYKFYSNFNIKIDDSYDYYKKCSNITESTRNNNCHTVNQITEEWKNKFNNFSPDTNNVTEPCYLLVLWIYDRIKGCNSNNFCISWFYVLLKKILDESECCKQEEAEDKNKHICEDKFINTFNSDVLKNKRDLYDFLEYHDHTEDIFSRIYKQNNEEYCEYIKYILKLYHKLEDEYKERGLSHIYEKELNLFRNKFSKNQAISSIKSKCNINDSIIESKRSFDNTSSFSGNQKKGVARRTISPEYELYDPRTSTDIKAVLSELSSKIYKELENAVGDNDYKSNHCSILNGDIKNICEKLARNLKVLSTNNETKKESYRDRCTYLNFWIYDEISKLYKNEDKNLTDITDVAKLIDANININMDLIKDDFKKNNDKLKQQTTITDQRAKSTNSTSPKTPAKFVKHYELSKHEPCYFNYNCTFSGCREMKHLFEYFKNYDKIKGKFDCVKAKNDKYFKYFKYISFLYNKHKENCCSWGATVCSDYFLECDEYYDPNKLVSAIESHDQKECKKIKDSLIADKSEETSNINPKDENNMYIKYFTCSYVTDSTFKKKGLRCQQPGYSPFRKNNFSPVRAINNAKNNNLKLKGKKLTINGKSINAVLISDPNEIITREDGEEYSMPGYNYTLFSEIRGTARKAYIKQGEEACKNGNTQKGMEEYCRKSKRYNKIINLSNSQPANLTLKEDIENWEDIAIPDDTSFLSEILQQLPVRMGAVSLASLGAITMLFMYYKFTPLGSWLRNAMGGEKKMPHGNDIEPRISLNYQQDHMPQNSQRKRIKIAYQTS